MIAALEERYLGLGDRVEVVDVATPVTYERYTANWRGAFAGWALTTRKMSVMMGGGMDKTVPGLDGFWMIGPWVESGGNVELSAASGRDVIVDLCRLEGKPFVTPRGAEQRSLRYLCGASALTPHRIVGHQKLADLVPPIRTRVDHAAGVHAADAKGGTDARLVQARSSVLLTTQVSQLLTVEALRGGVVPDRCVYRSTISAISCRPSALGSRPRFQSNSNTSLSIGREII